ncbi:MAG: TIGR03546 family protein [Proteobacteria bacterium]|nr:TIGR03546 family protein [Pseudomonadota bacterium]
MTLVWTIQFLQFLGKDKTDFQIALGITTGMMLGLVPVTTLHWFLLLIFVFALRMNLLATMVSALFFAALSFLLSTPIESFGFWTLTSHSALIPIFVRAYHAPIIPFTAFHHTDVMGGTFLGVLLFFPMLVISQRLTHRYRDSLHAYWLSTRIQRAYVHYRRFSN